MKKIIPLLLVTILLLCPCGNARPSYVTDEEYDSFSKIIEHTDSYLSYDISYEEYSERLGRIKERVANGSETWHTIAKGDIDNLLFYAKEEDTSKIKEIRERMVKTIGYKK